MCTHIFFGENETHSIVHLNGVWVGYECVHAFVYTCACVRVYACECLRSSKYIDEAINSKFNFDT